MEVFYGDFENVIVSVYYYYERNEKINNCCKCVIIRIGFVVVVVDVYEFFSKGSLVG